MTKDTCTKVAVGVFAHADDETLLAGALIAKLVHDGWKMHLLCLAPGDDDRASRLELAAKDLGVKTVSSLRFAPSGNESGGSPSLASAPEAVVVERIAGKLAELGPQMVFTHSAEGDYGHIDHVICHRATVNAASTAVPNSAAYALEWPHWLIKMVPRLLRAFTWQRGELTETGPTEQRAASASPPTAEIEKHRVSQYLGARKRASRRYSKEISAGPLPFRLLEVSPTWLQRPILGVVRLRRIR